MAAATSTCWGCRQAWLLIPLTLRFTTVSFPAIRIPAKYLSTVSESPPTHFLVNGGDVEESVQNGASIVPTLDSIQELRLLTNSFNAEYGRFSGAIVNVLTKPGTNEIHGSVYEFLRNEKLDARSYFDQERGDFKRNQFGGTIGAPVVKNKLFFFGDYQGTREVRGVSSGLINVPSVLERSGDFSELTDDFTGTVRGNDDPTVDPNRTNFPFVLTQRLGYTVATDEPYWFPG